MSVTFIYFVSLLVILFAAGFCPTSLLRGNQVDGLPRALHIYLTPVIFYVSGKAWIEGSVPVYVILGHFSKSLERLG